LFYLIPQPLLPGEKGSKKMIFKLLRPSSLGRACPASAGDLGRGKNKKVRSW